MQLFSADPTMFSKKINVFFAHENMKKLCSKVAHNRPQTFTSTARLVLTFYSTRLARQKFYLEKNLSSESSRVKFKNGIHSTRSSFHCFVSSEFRVLVEYFWRSIVIFMHLQKMFCPTKWWYAKCSFDNK